jgi:hypothetical protein
LANLYNVRARPWFRQEYRLHAVRVLEIGENLTSEQDEQERMVSIDLDSVRVWD